MFALYGVNLTEATAAVLIYRLFALLVPAFLGAPAFVLLRRRLARADQPALVCAPLGLEVVKLPAQELTTREGDKSRGGQADQSGHGVDRAG